MARAMAKILNQRGMSNKANRGDKMELIFKISLCSIR